MLAAYPGLKEHPLLEVGGGVDGDYEEEDDEDEETDVLDEVDDVLPVDIPKKFSISVKIFVLELEEDEEVTRDDVVDFSVLDLPLLVVVVALLIV